MIYLASPYTHKDPEVELSRFEQACEVAGQLMKMGVVVYSPIAHCHPIAKRVELPTGWEFWKTHCEGMLRIASGFAVLIIQDWEESIGVEKELKLARELGLSIYHIHHVLENGRSRLTIVRIE